MPLQATETRLVRLFERASQSLKLALLVERGHGSLLPSTLVRARASWARCPAVLGTNGRAKYGLDSGNCIGVWAALTVSLLSSFAGVYLEKMIKADQVSLPVRNVQLCLYSVPLQLLRIVSDREYDRVMPSGLCASSWVLAVNLAFAGLLVAYMMRYADNNLKNLAMALAILLSCVASIPLFGFVPNGIFGAGALLVCASIFLYAWQPKPAAASNYVPLETAERLTPLKGRP